MSSFGKTIRLFFVEGSANSMVTAELSNWTGIGVRVPKIRVKDFLNRSEFQRPGVYILLGRNEVNADQAYIGEAEVLGDRLTHHVANKEFWNEVIFYCSKDKYLNKASVKYLENRMHELAQKAGRYQLDQNIPTKSELSEAEQAELEEFLSNIKLLTASLGYRIFEALSETSKIEIKPGTEIITSQTSIPNYYGELFNCSNAQGAFGVGSPSTEGFLVLQGSNFMLNDQPSLSDSIKQEKQSMLQQGILIEEDGLLKLNKDYAFNSPSRAASMLLARSANGLTEWKTKEGKTLKQYLS